MLNMLDSRHRKSEIESWAPGNGQQRWQSYPCFCFLSYGAVIMQSQVDKATLPSYRLESIILKSHHASDVEHGQLRVGHFGCCEEDNSFAKAGEQ